MTFPRAMQNLHAAVIAEYQTELSLYKIACKAYSLFRLAAQHELASPQTVYEERQANKVFKGACKKFNLARAKFVDTIRTEARSTGELDISDIELSNTMTQTNQTKLLEMTRESAIARSTKQVDVYVARCIGDSLHSGLDEDIRAIGERAKEEYARATQLNGGVEPAWDQVQHILAPAAPTTPEEIKTNISTNTVEPLTVEEFAILTARDFSSTDSEAAATDDTVRIIKPTVKEDFTLDMSDTI